MLNAKVPIALQVSIWISFQGHASPVGRNSASVAMFFTGLFSLFAATMLVAWFGTPRKAFMLFALAMVLTGALYLHHASSKLPLSF